MPLRQGMSRPFLSKHSLGEGVLRGSVQVSMHRWKRSLQRLPHFSSVHWAPQLMKSWSQRSWQPACAARGASRHVHVASTRANRTFQLPFFLRAALHVLMQLCTCELHFFMQATVFDLFSSFSAPGGAQST